MVSGEICRLVRPFDADSAMVRTDRITSNIVRFGNDSLGQHAGIFHRLRKLFEVIIGRPRGGNVR